MLRTAFLLAIALASTFKIVAVRFAQNPLVTPASSLTLGSNINGPSLIRVPVWVEHPLGRYYLYFAHHAGKFIRLAYANDLSGPWRVYEPGTLPLGEAHKCADHIASSDIHIDEAGRRILMYFHCPAGTRGSLEIGQQKTFLATSKDGIRFAADTQPLGPAYFRVFRWKGFYYAVVRGGGLLRSRAADAPPGAQEARSVNWMFDTNAISALVHHRAGWEQFARRIDGLTTDQRLISTITLSELLTMIAKAEGRIRAYLEPRGIKIGPMDTLLAAHALSIGATVVTGNMREFARVPGLPAENWLH